MLMLLAQSMMTATRMDAFEPASRPSRLLVGFRAKAGRLGFWRGWL